MASNRKKTMVTMIAAAMAAAMVIGGGSFAYLQSQSNTVTNKFNTNIVEVSAGETDLKDDNTKDYDIIPGKSDPKDPFVTIKNTVPAYLFVTINDTTDGLVQYEVDTDSWKKLPGYDKVYYRVVPASEKDENGQPKEQKYYVLKGGENAVVSYDAALENKDMVNKDGTLKDGYALAFVGFGIQQEPFYVAPSTDEGIAAAVEEGAVRAYKMQTPEGQYEAEGKRVVNLNDEENSPLVYTPNPEATPEQAAADKKAAADALKNDLQNATDPGVAFMAEGKNLVWETEATHGSSPLIPAGNETTQEVVFDGGEDGGTLTATGSGVGQMRAANGGTLIFKNMTIIDESKSYAENSWEYGYLEFAGKVIFENCHFKSAIVVDSSDGVETDIEFTNCTFETETEASDSVPTPSNMYAVWVSDGKATFTNCEFKGPYRGLKVHEAYGTEIKNVTVDGCTFGPLQKKPGIALGTLNPDTSVSITNCTFNNCKAGDQGLYSYETDTDVETFDFTYENNTINNG